MHLVETVLKSIIETGFADNCKEELLEFDKDGVLVSRKPGVTDRAREAYQANDDKYSFPISQSGNPSLYNEDLSQY